MPRGHKTGECGSLEGITFRGKSMQWVLKSAETEKRGESKKEKWNVEGAVSTRYILSSSTTPVMVHAYMHSRCVKRTLRAPVR